MADYFSEEIWVEIFKRLAVKSLFRIRCVQKSWRDLIQTPHFINLHSNYSKNKYLIFHRPSKGLFSIRFDDKQCEEYRSLEPQFFENEPLRSYGTSNGIICLSTFPLFSHRNNIRLWNPVIGKYKTLPASPKHFHLRLYLHFEVRLAFGYLPKIDDYKVIKVTFYDVNKSETLSKTVDVYSLRSNSWKTISDDGIVNFSSIKSGNSVVVNNDIVWLGKRTNSDEKVIVYFDTENEIIREISIPKDPQNYNFEFIFIHMVGEILFLFFYYYHSGVFDIWVPENGVVDGVWTKKCSLEFKKIGFPVGFRNIGEILLKKINRYEFVSYDIKKQQEQRFVGDSFDLWSSGEVSGSASREVSGSDLFVKDVFVNPQTMPVDLFMENLVLFNEK